MTTEFKERTALGALKLGPDGFNKIAILGTAPTSMELAPFDDPSWAIWACSPGAFPKCASKRSDVWFEPHRWMPTAPGLPGAPGTKPWFSADFNTFLKGHKGPVFMSQVQPSIPTSVRIPYEDLIAKYGPYFWTSTIAYMIAMAIDQLQEKAKRGEQTAIGLWGVDMSATEEWSYQRPGCQHFIGIAMSLGINVMLPEESDLMRPPTMYGIGEHNPRHVALLARKTMIEAQKAQCAAQHNQLGQNILTMNGQLAELEHVLQSWCDDLQPDLRHAVSFSREAAHPTGELSGNEPAAAQPAAPVVRRKRRSNGAAGEPLVAPA